jgi:hypothetical protein
VGISVDTVAKNAAMVEKLMLPFSLLSDARGALIQRFGVWNAEEHIAVPTIAVVDQAGTIVYFYSGRDFADRPGDAAVFEALDGMERVASYPEEEPEIRVTAVEAQQSVGPEKRAMTIEELLPYYRGAFFASVALKGRLATLGERERDAVHEITGYQRLVREYQEALRATAKMKE